MNILSEIHNKIDEMERSGMNRDEIVSEGLKYLKDMLLSSSYKERKHFFLNIERDEKIDKILKK